MNTKHIAKSSWIALAIAILSWSGVAFFAFFLVQMQAEHSANIAEAAAASTQEGQSAQLRALARETEDDRVALNSATNVDLLTAVNTIEAVNASGTSARVTNAQPIKSSGKASVQQVNIVELNIETDGDFSSVMKVVQMLEALPLATMVQEVDLNRKQSVSVGKNPPAQWSANIRLRFYTTAALSS
jgi:hypothetical protein